MYRPHHQGDKNWQARNNVSSNQQLKHAEKKYYVSSILWLLVNAIIPSSPILVTLMMMEVICSSETLVLTRATWHNIPQDDILHSHHCKNFKSYN
jgi:hypothetical protein